MPEKDSLVSYVIGTGSEPYKSSSATANFAAVMAIAARVYKPFDAKFAARALSAAGNAWRWLDKYPDVRFHNPPGVGTGTYDSDNGDSARLWAAAELWRTTRQDEYNRYFLAHFMETRSSVGPTGPPSWEEVGPLALWTYVFAAGGDANAKRLLREDLLQAANAIVARTTANRYRVSLGTAEYKWSSNSIAANYGMELLVANAMGPDRRYVDSALDDLHYLLGRNTFSLSWVTEVGENAFQHPHHRPSAAMPSLPPWPGLLSGGPNSHRDDAVTKALPPNLPPAKVYADDAGSYSSNEVAINWNAGLVFLLAGVLPQR
jgi:endoglucanase